MLVVTRTVVQLEVDPMGGYRLRVVSNVAGATNPCWDETYGRLLWTEAIDVLLEELDSRRPGHALDEGRRWSMAPLFDWGGPSA